MIKKNFPGEDPGETPATRETPTVDNKPYDVIDRVVDHGEADDGMPELPTGTPVWRVHLYGQKRTEDLL